MAAGTLGRRAPSDWSHVTRYALSALPDHAQPTNVPVVWGVNWYRSFDTPEYVGGRWVISRIAGPLDGGHAICGKPRGMIDLRAWRVFYDQGKLDACVGFSVCRAMTLLNRRRYDAVDVWRRARLADEWTDNDAPDANEGTSVRAGFDVLVKEGPRRVVHGVDLPADVGDGISAYRWATNVEEVSSALGYPDVPTHLPWLQSWGPAYPHIVYVDVDAVLSKLLADYGEAGIPTDR